MANGAKWTAICDDPDIVTYFTWDATIDLDLPFKISF
jgi:hypothetical protein